MSWYSFVLHRPLPGEEALVKAITIDDNPAKQRVQPGKEGFRRTAQMGQGQTHPDANGIEMVRRWSLDKLLYAILPGSHNIQRSQPHACAFVSKAAQAGLYGLQPRQQSGQTAVFERSMVALNHRVSHWLEAEPGFFDKALAAEHGLFGGHPKKGSAKRPQHSHGVLSSDISSCAELSTNC